MLAVVEHEQQLAGREEAGQGVAEILRREGADVERGRHTCGHEPRVGHCAELDEGGTRLERALGAAGELEREARLARAARAREREQPGAPEE